MYVQCMHVRVVGFSENGLLAVLKMYARSFIKESEQYNEKVCECYS